MVNDPYVLALAEWRLRRSLTFKQVADHMAAAGYPVHRRTLNIVCTGRLQTAPLELTRYKIACFVDRHVRPRKPVKAVARKRRRRVAA